MTNQEEHLARIRTAAEPLKAWMSAWGEMLIDSPRAIKFILALLAAIGTQEEKDGHSRNRVLDDLARKEFAEGTYDLMPDEACTERGHGSGPLPGRDVTVVQTPDKTLFVRKVEEK